VPFVLSTDRHADGTATEAVRTLLDLMKNPTSTSVRWGAARAVLGIGMKVRDIADLEERLAEWEQRMGATAS